MKDSPMKNPLLKIDVNQIPDQGTYILNWFNPNTVAYQQLLLTEVEVGDLRTKLLKKHNDWNVPTTENDPNKLPTYSHTSNNIIKFKLNNTDVYSDDETVNVDKSFIYVILDDIKKEHKMEPIGYIAGNISISGDYTLNDHKDNPIELMLEIKAIELDPSYRGVELGTFISHQLMTHCEELINGTFAQFSKNSLSKVTITPKIETTIYSTSGEHWFKHLSSLYESKINEIVSRFIPSKRINDEYLKIS